MYLTVAQDDFLYVKCKIKNHKINFKRHLGPPITGSDVYELLALPLK